MSPLRYPLLGLEAALADEACDRVELHRAAEPGPQAFTREAEDTWAPDDPSAAPLHTRDLLALIQDGFGEACSGVACFVGGEVVEYVLERGSVRVRRGPREEPVTPDALEHVGLAPVAEALGIPGTKRKAKLTQAVQFARIVDRALGGGGPKALRVLDLACGRSYLGFVLVHLLAARGREVTLQGVDCEPALVGKCRDIAATLQWSNAAFEVADLAAWSAEPDSYDLVVSLHGCDTLTDEAIRIAVQARVPLLFVAPCCQHELRHQWKRHPLDWIARYGLLEQRLADVLTDGFRCLVLEALGYQVKTLRFAAPEVTPKNLLLQARLTSAPRPARARDAAAFMALFGVRPTLARLLEPHQTNGS